MKVLNIHKRIIDQPITEVVALLKTLSTDDDKIWPMKKWPRMKFEGGIRVGAKGGHGPIRYTVEKYNPSSIIQFRFSKPRGFDGVHKFEIREISAEKTEVKHTIDMRTTITGTLKWVLAIRALHNALIEDGFDRIENRSSEWKIWVKLMRKLIARRINR